MSDVPFVDEAINPQGFGCYGPEGGTLQVPKVCNYCYAKKMAKRLGKLRNCEMCHLFVPHWHPEVLQKPYAWKKPRSIFMCDMSDLLHPETPAWQIKVCIDLARDLPRHTFLFFTKNPRRYNQFKWPDNCWLMATADNKNRADKTMDIMQSIRHINKGLIIEPLMEDVSIMLNLSTIKWLIIGGLNPRPVHKPDWIKNILKEADKFNIPIYMKYGYKIQNKPRPLWDGQIRQEKPF